MEEFAVYVTPTVKNWRQYMGGGGGDDRGIGLVSPLDRYGDPWPTWFYPYHWAPIEATIYYGGHPGEKTLYSEGGWARQGMVFSKSWGRSSLYPGMHNASVRGSLTEYTCEVSFNIPATPAGCTLIRVEWTEVSATTINTIVKRPTDDDFPTAGSIFTYTPDDRWGVDNDWHGLCQPDEPGEEFWDYGPHSIAGDSASTGIPPLIGVPSMTLIYITDDPECVDIESGSVTNTGATLTGASSTHWRWGVVGDDIGEESETGILTGLEPDTEYWYSALSYCEEKRFRFKTEKDEDKDYWGGVIITLPVTEVWASSFGQGATLHGMLKFPPRNNTKTWYLAIGFQLGPQSNLSSSNVMWNRTGNFTAYKGNRATIYPIQITTSGLMPDINYYYRACLHKGTPPMNVNNHFGETLSFGGPVSEFGVGREYVTAKKAEDDISRLAAGRYYMDKSGIFQYESNQRRKTA